MEIRQLKYFIEVAERQHVTEAANALHVAQSAVSRQIANLEKELGVELFFREGRNVKLTPIGQVFLNRIKHAMNVIDDATREITEYVDPKKGTIQIAFPVSMATHTVPNAISLFKEQYPDVKFVLKQKSHVELLEGVTKGDFNVALIAPVPMDEKKLLSKILFTENLVALLPVRHPLANKSAISLRELKDDSFVMLPEGVMLREIILNACEKQRFEPKIAFEGQDMDALKGLVAAGLGITLMPETTLIDNLPRSTVKIPLYELNISRTVGLITPKERELLPTEQLFYEFLIRFYSRLNEFKG